jgi:hypothetical protein
MASNATEPHARIAISELLRSKASLASYRQALSEIKDLSIRNDRAFPRLFGY